MHVLIKTITCLSVLGAAACGSSTGTDSPAGVSRNAIVKGSSLDSYAAQTPSLSVGYFDGTNTYGTCGGVLVKNDVVLTAAHCIMVDSNKSTARRPVSDMRVCQPDAGGTCLAQTVTWANVTAMWHPPELIAAYKKHDIARWARWDWALLRLASPITGTLATPASSIPSTVSHAAVFSPQRNSSHGDFSQAIFQPKPGYPFSALSPTIDLTMSGAWPDGALIEKGDSGSGWYAWENTTDFNQLLAVTSNADIVKRTGRARTQSQGANLVLQRDYVNNSVTLMSGNGRCVYVPAMVNAVLPANPATLTPSTVCLSLSTGELKVNVYQQGSIVASHSLALLESVIQPILDNGVFGVGYHNGNAAVALLGDNKLQLRALDGTTLGETAFDTTGVSPASLNVAVKDADHDNAGDVVVSRDDGTTRVYKVSGTSLVEDSTERLFPGHFDDDSLIDYLRITSGTDGSLYYQVILAKNPLTTSYGISSKTSGFTVGGTVDVWREPINVRPSLATSWALRGFAIQSNGNAYLGYLTANGEWEKQAKWLWSTAQSYAKGVTATAMVSEYDAARQLAALNVELSDGSVARFPYTDSGLSVPSNDGDLRTILTGLPTARSNDGKFLTVSGYGNATVATAQERLRVRFANALPTSNPLIQVFDADMSGAFDVTNDQLRTCIQIAPDPCGALGDTACTDACGSDGVMGASPEGKNACLGTFLPTQPAIRTWDESNDADAMAFADNGWGVLELPSSTQACAAAQDPAKCASSTSTKQEFTYELRVFLRDVNQTCDNPPGENDELALSGVNAFKVRSTGRIGHPTGALAFVGFDDLGLTNPSSPDTDYDQRFEFNVASAWAATNMTLTDMDADDLDDTDSPAEAQGANHEISYQLLTGTQALNLANGGDGGSDCTNYSTTATDLSGNCLGTADDANCDVEERKICSAVASTGSLKWVFSNVGAYNNVYITAPHGSPISYEIQSSPADREKPVTTQGAAAWALDTSLASLLPIVLGTVNRTSGALEGGSVRISNPSAAQAILNGNPTTITDRITQQLLVAELNRRSLLSQGRRFDTAIVYGTTRSVHAVLLDAQAFVRGPSVAFDATEAERTFTLLQAVNLGDVSYLQVGTSVPVAPTSDPDYDGVISWKDNCPTTANPDQLDSNWDGIGDACRIIPILDCVVDRGNGTFTGFLGYSSPLEQRTLPVGHQNYFDGATPDVGQPSEFPGGEYPRVFKVDFASSTILKWKLDGSEVTLSATSPRCSGSSLLTPAFAPQTAIYATDQLLIRDGVKVIAPTGTASIISGNYVELGSNASTGSIWAAGNVWVRSSGTVTTGLIAGGTLSVQQDGVVPASKVDHAYVPGHSIAWAQTFPSSTQAAIFQESNMPLRVLAPMAYTDLTVRGQVKLTTGTYYFNNLTVEGQGTLVLDQSAGPVVIYVKTSFNYSGKTTVTSGGTSPRLLVGYFGTRPSYVESSFVGDIIAPAAQVVLGNQLGGLHVGRFFAKNVEVRTAAVVKYHE